jgi:O-antigen ligase
VGASGFNPSFTAFFTEGERVLMHRGATHASWPSTVNPSDTWRALWFCSTVYLAAANLVFVVRRRSALRTLMTVIAVNTLVLAIYGTLQKLSGAGFYFGQATSPNPRFFATFIYYNHWGAFMVLGLGGAAALIFHQAKHQRGRDLWHSPFPMSVLGLIVIAITAPVSASRAATGMAATMLTLVLGHGLIRIAAVRRSQGRTAAPVIVSVLILALTTTVAVGWLAQRSIQERYTDTRTALSANPSLFDSRMELYRDTWALAQKQPVFGWGLESYATAFMLVRPRPLEATRQYEKSYADAHSDWLQSFAETGFVGTALVVLMGLLPLTTLPRASRSHPFVIYPLLGCAFVALYACIEFPFGNGAVLITFWTFFFAAIRYAQLYAAEAHA